jgi:hypothetical protein
MRAATSCIVGRYVAQVTACRYGQVGRSGDIRKEKQPVIAPESLGNRAGRRGTTDRVSYLIDRFHVAYAFGGGWTCGCREFASHDSCKHTREAAGRRAAQLRITQYLRQNSGEALSFHTADVPAVGSERIEHATGGGRVELAPRSGEERKRKAGLGAPTDQPTHAEVP